MANIRISAYTDKLSVKAGDTLNVMASADATETMRAQLVRLIHGDEHPDGPGFMEQPVASPIDRDWPVRKQYIQKGNFLRVADADKQARTDRPDHASCLHLSDTAGSWPADAAGTLVGRRHQRFRPRHQSVRPARILGRRRHRDRRAGGRGQADPPRLVFRCGRATIRRAVPRRCIRKQ